MTRLRAGWGFGAGDEDRTRVASLEDWSSTIELLPQWSELQLNFTDFNVLSQVPARRLRLILSSAGVIEISSLLYVKPMFSRYCTAL